MGARRGGAAILLSIVVSAACLALLARAVNGRDILEALASARVPVLALALVAKAVCFLFLALRTRALFARFGRFGVHPFVMAHLLGFGANALLPLRLGELLRMDELARRTGVPRSASLGVIVVERALDTLWLAAVALALGASAVLGRATPGRLAPLLVVVVLALAAAIGIGARPRRLAALVERWGGWLGGRATRLVAAAEGFATGLSAAGSARRLAWASLDTLGYWGCAMLGVVSWIRAFDLHLPWYASAVVTVFLALGAALPAAPGYVGTYHLAAVTAFVLLGVSPGRAAAVAVAGHFVSTVPAALLSFALFSGRVRGALDG